MVAKNSVRSIRWLAWLFTGAALQPSWAQIPGDVTIITEDTVLSADNFGPIWIATDGITLNCRGFEIVESNPVDQEEMTTPQLGRGGVVLFGTSDVTVRNCTIRDFWNGIRVFGGDGNRLIGNTVVETQQPVSGWTVRNGYLLDNGATNNLLFGNVEADVFGDGISLLDANDNVLIANTVGGHGWGIALFGSHRNEFNFNRVRGDGLGGDGFHLSGSDGSLLYLNRIDGWRDGVRIQQSSSGSDVRVNVIAGNEHGILICPALLGSSTVAPNAFRGNSVNVETSLATEDPLQCSLP